MLPHTLQRVINSTSANRLFFSPLFASLAGGMQGLVEVFWLSGLFKKRSFGQKLLPKNLFYLGTILKK